MLRRRLVVAGLALGWGAMAHPVEIVVDVAWDPPSPIAMTVTMSRAASGGRPEEVRHIEITAPRRMNVEVPDGELWSVEAEGQGVWAPAQTFTAAPPESTRPVRLLALPAAPFSGLIHTAPDEQQPSAVTISEMTWPGSEESQSEPLTRRCPVGSDGSLSCQFPVGVHDLKLRAPGFLSRFYWNARVPSTGFDIGEVALESGASLVAFVTDAGGQPVKDAEVIAWTGHGRHEPATPPATTNSRGVAILENLAPGTWKVRARMDGRSASRIAVVKVLERTETTLGESLVVAVPVMLSVSVAPAADPLGEPWVVTVREAGRPPGPDLAADPAETDSGGWVHVEVPPGSVSASVGDSLGGLWHREVLEIATTPPPLIVKLDLIEVAGLIVSGPQELSGVIRWRTLQSSEQPRMALARIDEDSRFRVFLPHEGRWKVEVENADGAVTPSISVDIDDPGDGEPIEVELEFPVGAVIGRVLDPDGHPVPAASVQAIFYDASRTKEMVSASSQTDAGGAFRIAAARSGTALLTARDERGRRGEAEVRVREGKNTEVELRLSRSTTLRGRVVSEGRPVIGASVQALPVGSGAFDLSPVLTDARGRFEVDLPESSTAGLAVIPPSEGAVLTLADPAAGEAVVEVPRLSGALTVLWSSSGSGDPVIRTGPVSWPVQILAILQSHRGATISNGRSILPAVAPGSYVICSQSASGPPTCVETEVVPYGEAVSDLR